MSDGRQCGFPVRYRFRNAHDMFVCDDVSLYVFEMIGNKKSGHVTLRAHGKDRVKITVPAALVDPLADAFWPHLSEGRPLDLDYTLKNYGLKLETRTNYDGYFAVPIE